MPPAVVSTRLAAAAMLGLGGLHLVWATGSPWPFASRRALARGAVGRRDVPGPAACLAVAGLLTTGAALVSGRPRNPPGLSRLGAAGVTATFALRGGLGLSGRTDLVSPGSHGAHFRRLDRRIYSPLCLGIAAAALPAVVGRSTHPTPEDPCSTTSDSR